MSWFEPGAFASLAKNAIKEAQKTIDKALDIREDATQDIYAPISPVIKKQLKEESESFSPNFVLPERAENVDLTKSSSHHETAKSKESSSGAKVAGNLWGSFTGSFFDSPKNAADKGSSRSSSAPITPSDKVVATQPPRSVSGLPPSSQGLELEYSSQSSSIIQLSMDNMPLSPTTSIQSPFMQETEDPFVTVEHSILNVEDGTNRKEEGWDWGWDSSIMVMSSDPKLKEDSCHFKSNPLLQEESLVDDDPDADEFAKSRLIVGSVNSESSNSLPRESLNSLNSSRSLPEIDTLFPVVEEVFAEVKEAKLRPHLITESAIHPESSELRASVHDLGEEEASLSEKLGGGGGGGYCLSSRPPDRSVVESPDSIIILDSTMASPVNQSSAEFDKPYFLLGPSIEDVADPDLSTGGSVNSPTTPSSIEVLSTSTEVSSPPAAESSSHTLSDDLSTSTSNTKKSSDYGEKPRPFTTDSPDGPAASSAWQTTTVSDSDRHAITRQPVSSSSVVGKAAVGGEPQEKANSLEAEQSAVVYFGKDSDGEAGVVKESCQSGSDLTTIATPSGKLAVDSGAASDSPTESSSQASFIHTPPHNLGHSGFVSMNAAEIRKKLDKVDRETESIASLNSLRDAKGEEDPSLQEEDESVPSESSCMPLSNLLEMSSRSESSTDTVTASMDSQHMGWTDIGSIEILVDESECVRMKEETDEQEAMDEGGEGAKSRPLLDEATWPVVAHPNPEANHPTNEPADRELSPGSSESRSDVLKVDSSGHSSADEMETATSSDIEVISSPSIDGSINGNSRSSSGVPSVAIARGWMTAPRGLRTFVNEKAEEMAVAVSSHSAASCSRKENGNGQQGETVPSSMTTSFTSISESDGDSPHMPRSEILQLEASRITQMLLQDIATRTKGHRRNESNFSETSESSLEPTSLEMEKLLTKISHLTEILESRETKVLELSHVNVSLQDANSALKGRLEELEGLRKGSESSECLREEFTQRLVAMERKFQQALRDKETAKKQLEEYKAEVSSRRSDVDLARELEERDVTISELRREGEKLSKQQLSYSNIVKKLRTKEKENDDLIQDQKEKIESLSMELERLRKQLRAKEEVERRQIDAIGHLTATTQRQADEIQTTRADNAELEGKLSVLKEALDTAYKEMAELRRSEATRDAEAHEASLSAEIAARETVEAALAEERRRSHREQEALLAQIHELQEEQGRNEALRNRKERQMRGEIQDLLQRLSEAESRASEMSNSVSAATRPLLRQMENIQVSQQAQQAAWEGMEDSLTKRLNEAQKLASTSAKREREAKENLASAMTELTSLQSQVGSLQTETIQLKTKLEVFTLKAASLEEAKIRETNQLDALKASFAEEIKEVKHERDVLEQQLEVERTAANAEKKKLTAVQEQLKEKERKLAQLQAAGGAGAGLESHLSTPRSSPTPSLSRFSLSGSVNESYAGSHWGEDVFDPSWVGQRGSSVYDSVRGNNAATVDILTSSLRQREGEVHHLQSELSRLEAHKESLAQELVQSARRSEEYLEKVQELEQMKEAQKDMDQKYNALLQMYGEKVEEVEELRLDLEDVKEMYKLQIDHLMQK